MCFNDIPSQALYSKTSDKITQEDYQMQDVHFNQIIMLLRVSTLLKLPLTVHNCSVC